LKLLILLIVIGAAAWWFFGRRRPGKLPRRRAASADPEPMLACAHCGVHLPQAEALTGPDGRPYCSAAHRLAGPR
jgi:uncharacterized protein